MRAKTKVRTMGVLNITPDSFSDGAPFQDRAGFESQLKERLGTLLHYGPEIIDIGAESTAPMNPAIGRERERERLHLFLEYLDHSEYDLKRRELSLDSYRVENVAWFFDELLKRGFKEGNLIWNDISGSFDSQLKELLNSYPKIRYIFCHNLAPTREESSEHMKYCYEGDDIIGHLRSFFKPIIEKCPAALILDPCFGFSKSYEDNIRLFQAWSELSVLFPHWVFGVSKKSFLRREIARLHGSARSREEALQESEYLHLLWLREVLRNSGHLESLYLRVHSPLVAKLALDWAH